MSVYRSNWKDSQMYKNIDDITSNPLYPVCFEQYSLTVTSKWQASNGLGIFPVTESLWSYESLLWTWKCQKINTSFVRSIRFTWLGMRRINTLIITSDPVDTYLFQFIKSTRCLEHLRHFLPRRRITGELDILGFWTKMVYSFPRWVTPKILIAINTSYVV